MVIVAGLVATKIMELNNFNASIFARGEVRAVAREAEMKATGK